MDIYLCNYLNYGTYITYRFDGVFWTTPPSIPRKVSRLVCFDLPTVLKLRLDVVFLEPGRQLALSVTAQNDRCTFGHLQPLRYSLSLLGRCYPL